jgi:PAS domain S-box-containing protein
MDHDMKETKEVNPESRWTKKALLESEKRYRRLLDNSPDIIFRMSLPDRKFEYVSPAAEQITGYPPEDFYSQGGLLEKLFHPDWQEYFKKEWKALLKGKISPSYEYPIIDRAKKTRWLRQTNMLVTDEGGHPVAVEGIITDITGRRQAEAALQKSEEQYRNLVETTGTGYVILDKGGRVVTANQEYVRLTGRADLAKIQGKPVTDWTAPHDLERNLREIEQCFRDGKVRSLEIDYLRPDGSIQPVEMNGSVIQSDAGQIILTLCRDITERRRVEYALKGEQEFTRLLLDASPAYFVAIGADGRTIMMNKALTDVLEYRPDKIQGADYLSTFVPEEERERVGRVFCEIASDGKITVNENWITSKSGKSYLVEWHGRPVKQMAGKPDFFVGVGIDITRRREMEEELRETEKKLSFVMDGVPALLAYVDADMRFFYVNKAYADWYGLTREEIIGKQVRDLLDDDVFERALPNYLEVLRGIPVEYENRTVDAEGKEHFVSARLIPDYRDNKVAGWFAAVIDITERKLMEEELRESEATIRALMNSPVDFMFIIDQNGIILDMNNTISNLMGWDHDEKVGTCVYDLLPPDRAELKRACVEELVRTKEPIRGEGRHGEIWLDQSIHPVFDSQGNVTKIAIVSRDITDRKKVEEALQQANRQLNLLSGITRHDIMNKITTILGYLSLAEMELKNPQMVDYLAHIESATRAIRSQIEFTKVYENLGTHEPQWQDLNIIVALSPHLPSTMKMNADVQGIEVMADPMIERVFFNLLDNAVRHGGHMTTINVSSYLSGDTLTIIWEDNGVGVPVEEKEKIFERGFGKNTGLGLFLAREVLLLTGIAIKETGEPGKGARFEIAVPKGMYR